MADIVRVLRIIEYTGPRDKVEDQVARSLHGEKRLPNGIVIRAATVGGYPEIIREALPPTVSWAPLTHEQAYDWFLEILKAAGYEGTPNSKAFDTQFVDGLRMQGVQVDIDKNKSTT